MASSCFKLPIRCIENGRRSINCCMIRHQMSEFEMVSNNISQLAINEFYADKNLVKLNFLYRKCILKIFVRPKSSGFGKLVGTEHFTDRAYEPLCNRKPSN